MVHPEDKFLLCRIFVSDSLLDLEDNLEGFPGGSGSKEFACNEGDLGSIPGLGRSPGGGHGNPLLYSCLGNPHEQRSLAGYRPWGYKESEMTKQLVLSL